MTRDDIIRMGREIAVQCCKRKPSTWTNEYAMSRIMELIDASIAAEREACAKMFDGEHDAYIALAIRARSKR